MEKRWNASAWIDCGRRSTRIVACHAGSLRRNAAWMPGDLAREKCRRDFRERLRAFGGEAKARVRGNGDVPAHRLRLRHFDARQRPVGRAERLVALEAELHDLPAGDGLAVDEAQFGVRSSSTSRRK